MQDGGGKGAQFQALEGGALLAVIRIDVCKRHSHVSFRPPDSHPARVEIAPERKVDQSLKGLVLPGSDR